MTYKLAKQLKDAAFPQSGRLFVGKDNKVLLHTSEHCACPRCYDYEEGYACIPTLSELIAACGDGFHFLSKVGTNFIAEQLNETEPIRISGVGSTPEEAVATVAVGAESQEGRTCGDGRDVLDGWWWLTLAKTARSGRVEIRQ